MVRQNNQPPILMSTQSRKWIARAIPKSHRGALHAQLHIPKGHPIPVDVLEAAAQKKGKTGQRARLALTLRRMH